MAPSRLTCAGLPNVNHNEQKGRLEETQALEDSRLSETVWHTSSTASVYRLEKAVRAQTACSAAAFTYPPLGSSQSDKLQDFTSSFSAHTQIPSTMFLLIALTKRL